VAWRYLSTIEDLVDASGSLHHTPRGCDLPGGTGYWNSGLRLMAMNARSGMLQYDRCHRPGSEAGAGSFSLPPKAHHFTVAASWCSHAAIQLRTVVKLSHTKIGIVYTMMATATRMPSAMPIRLTVAATFAEGLPILHKQLWSRSAATLRRLPRNSATAPTATASIRMQMGRARTTAESCTTSGENIRG
jgi:hypothetical protein